MPAVTKVPLGAATLNRKWYLDVNTGTYLTPVWIGVFGIEDFKAPKDPTLQDDSDFDSGGYKSSTVTALGWSIDLKVSRKTVAVAPTTYDPGQEVLRAASDLLGMSNMVDVRWYEMTPGGPKVEAYRGYATVSWSPDGGAMDALETVTVTLTGKGVRVAITHPDGAAVVPTLLSVYPVSGPAAGGTLVVIRGTGFFLNGVDNIVASTGIKLGGAGGTAFTTWMTESDNVVYGVIPAKVAQAYNIVVYNAVGVSVSTCTFTTV